MKLRRSKPEETTESVVLDKPGGKGRPTPTRKEAEAAARAKARQPRSRKEQAQRQRELRSESSQRIRQGMKDGDERYLPARDKGPVRRFIRDYVDARFSFAEIVVPLMIVAIFLPSLVLPLFAVLLIDLLVLRYRVRKQVVARFGEENLKGVTYYSITRAMQMKFMRMPKAQRKIGEELPEHYR